jgi:adenine-specific DNA-methyltransferase
VGSPAELVNRTEERRRQASAVLDPQRRIKLGQFFTPAPAAHLIAAMPVLPQQGILRILDPGAGVGSLTAALVARILREAPRLTLDLVAVEAEPRVIPYLQQSLGECEETARERGTSISTTIIPDDLISRMTGFGRLAGPLAAPFDLVIMNPPYRKLGATSQERQALLADGVDCSNLYCTFLALGVLGLKSHGQIAAITPRSFANGPYFEPFRHFFLERMTLNRLHIFESRSAVFADSEVLQENIVFSAAKHARKGNVTISVSKSHADASKARIVGYSDIVKPSDLGQFIHIPSSDEDEEATSAFSRLPCKLNELGIRVSTGRVVDFRSREYLTDSPSANSVPLIYPGNLKEGRVRWPLQINKPQGIVRCPQTEKLLLPAEQYVTVKRFSAKEERRRIVAAVFNPLDAQSPQIAFENHLNIFHQDNRGLDERIARGLALWLSSTAVDTFFRIFSGHTQVNATDLRSMSYPSRQQLIALAEALGQGAWPDQEKTDSLVNSHIFNKEARDLQTIPPPSAKPGATD